MSIVSGSSDDLCAEFEVWSKIWKFYKLDTIMTELKPQQYDNTLLENDILWGWNK